jgi:hypothetical protein
MKGKLFSGIALIIMGILFLISNFEWIPFTFFWPVFVLIPGLVFGFAFLKDRKSYGFLMPFSVLTIISIVFFACEIFGWRNMQDLWPVFLIAPGCGFFLMYYFGEKEKALLYPATILSFLGLLFLSGKDAEIYVLPIILIGIGLWFLVFKKN